MAMNSADLPVVKEEPAADGARGPLLNGLAIYFVLLPIVLVYLIVMLLAQATGIGDAGRLAVDFLLFDPLEITAELQRMLVALLAGALGSYLHAVTSLTSFVGNRTLRTSWALWYYLRPFMGGVLALLFYFLVRGGFLLLVTDNGADSAKSFNAFGIAAVSGLVGMFSKQATDKMREVFDSLFKSAAGDAERADKLGEERIVTQEMIRRAEIAGVDLPENTDESLRRLRLCDLNRLVGARVTRIPVFAPDGSLRCIIHKGLLHQYMTEHAVSAADRQEVPDYDALTLGEVLDRDEETVCRLVAFVPPNATVGEAREEMQRVEGCQDVFVTERGSRDDKVLGWLTNGIITRAIRD